jgi:hypothetical protein
VAGDEQEVICFYYTRTNALLRLAGCVALVADILIVLVVESACGACVTQLSHGVPHIALLTHACDDACLGSQLRKRVGRTPCAILLACRCFVVASSARSTRCLRVAACAGFEASGADTVARAVAFLNQVGTAFACVDARRRGRGDRLCRTGQAGEIAEFCLVRVWRTGC